MHRLREAPSGEGKRRGSLRISSGHGCPSADAGGEDAWLRPTPRARQTRPGRLRRNFCLTRSDYTTGHLPPSMFNATPVT